MEAVTIHNIHKSYATVHALQGVSCTVNRGEIFGIIGPDGAGKSTLFKILTTLLLADEGEATVEGDDVVKDFRKIRKNIGYMPGTFSLYQDLTVEENINFFATLFGTTVEDNYHLIKEIYSQLEPFKNRPAGKLSGGMKQKLALSCALVHKPTVLFLDEPTTGVDPVSRKEFWDMLQRLKEQSITIMVSTPYMDEASLCDRIALIKEGRFLNIDTPQGIVSNYPETIWAVTSSQGRKLLNDLRLIKQIKTSFAFGDKYHVTVEKDFNTNQLEDICRDMGYLDVIVEPMMPTIEDCYMYLANN